jgi:hypothetical protein
MATYAEQIAAEYAARGLNPDGSPIGDSLPTPWTAGPTAAPTPPTQERLSPADASAEYAAANLPPPGRGTGLPFTPYHDPSSREAFQAWTDAQDREASHSLNAQRVASIEDKANRVAYEERKRPHRAWDKGGFEEGPLTTGQEEKLRDGLARGLDEETALKYSRGQIAANDVPKLPFIRDESNAPTSPGQNASAPAENESGVHTIPEVTVHSGKQGEVEAIFANGAGGAAKPAGGGGSGGGGGSSGLSMSSTTPGEGGSGGDFDAPYNAAMGAAEQRGAAEGDIAQAQGDAAGQRMAASEKAMADLQRANDRYNEIADKHYARLEQLNNEVATGTVDPDHWWHNLSTGNQIRYTLAAALGGFSAGVMGTPNQGLASIRMHIDNDIDAQKANLESKRHAAEGEKGLLAEAYQRTHNMQDAVLLAKQAAYDHVDNQLKQMTAGANSQIANANSKLLLADWDKWRQEEREKSDEFHQSQATKEMIALMRRNKGGGGGGANDKLVRKYGEDLDKRNIPAFEEAINRAEADLAANGSAGLGRVTNFFANHLGDWFVSNKGLNTRADLASAEGEAAKSMGRFGGASLNFARDLSQSRDPAKVRIALHAWRSKINAEKAAVAARYPGGVKEAYEARGGATSADDGGGPDIPHGSETPTE